MDHSTAVNIIAKFLNEEGFVGRFPVVLTEMRSSTLQEPDVLGFRCGPSAMVECKVQRNDFTREKRKGYRNSEDCAGNKRSYACPEGLIKPDEIPEKMGLLYIDELTREVEVIREPERQKCNREVEQRILYSALRQEVIDGNCKSLVV